MLKYFISLFAKEKIRVHVILLILSGLCSITLINILFSLAMNTKFIKAGALLIGFLLVSILFYYLYFQFIHAILPDVASHWLRNGLIAILLTFIILSLTPLHLPYYPVEHKIQISTTSALSFSHIMRIMKDATPQRVALSVLEFSGTWRIDGKFLVHQGSQEGQIQYQKVEFVRDDLYYQLFFKRQTEPASATITVDGESYEVVIEPANNGNETTLQKVLIEASPKPSSSQFWRLWIQVYPYFYRLTLFILVLASVSVILSRERKILNQMLRLGLFTVLMLLFWLTLNFQNHSFNYWTINSIFPLIALLFFFVFPFLIVALLRRLPKSKQIIIILTFLLAAGLRIYWVVMVPTAQVSDFGRFHHWALQLASGEPGLVIDRYSNFTRALSMLYRVFPTDNAMEVLNILFTFVTMFCLYQIGKECKQEEAGILAAYLFAIFPEQIGMVTIVCTDILAVALLTSSVLLIVMSMQLNKMKYLFMGAFLFGLSYIIRGAMLIYFPVLLFPVSLNFQKNIKVSVGKLGLIMLGFIAAVGLMTGLLNLIQVDHMMIDEGRNIIWPLVNGTNIEKGGRNNSEDQDMVFSWPAEEATRNGIKVVLERVFSDPVAYYRFLKIKYEYIFADASYGSITAFRDETGEFLSFKTDWKGETELVRQGYAQLSQYAYLIVLLAAVLASLKNNTSLKSMVLPSLIILVCSLGAYAFFEVQPRYHRPIIPSLILLAALFFDYRNPQKDRG
ncbi:MAG: glycosyltransferase family 39 protein [Anaerolineaceae bacterium]|nr:glycosyltransferase family 39 protein [Anaerolineaceae bacterium]